MNTKKDPKQFNAHFRNVTLKVSELSEKSSVLENDSSLAIVTAIRIFDDFKTQDLLISAELAQRSGTPDGDITVDILSKIAKKDVRDLRVKDSIACLSDFHDKLISLGKEFDALEKEIKKDSIYRDVAEAITMFFSEKKEAILRQAGICVKYSGALDELLGRNDIIQKILDASTPAETLLAATAAVAMGAASIASVKQGDLDEAMRKAIDEFDDDDEDDEEILKSRDMIESIKKMLGD